MGGESVSSAAGTRARGGSSGVCLSTVIPQHQCPRRWCLLAEGLPWHVSSLGGWPPARRGRGQGPGQAWVMLFSYLETTLISFHAEQPSPAGVHVRR